MVSDVTQLGTVCQPNLVRNGFLNVRVTTPSGFISTAAFPVTD